ncbi:putative 2-isopropylmalate synthase [Diaporthe ampelina]|uniref:2-isopropylmalate synthase n=1 Tax=Diaporthe ampelina TaxID=1214573 RepID=A0A0G2FG80_9PEZI|nr:putative 2-isopropylmalate synthase [Diaporthe ampelina]
MTIDQKLAFFKLLVKIGFKEIEVSTPTASDTEFNFTRLLIETPGLVPDDVWLQVLCPCRLDMIRQTVGSLRGANKAIISLYFASSPAMLDIVFGGMTHGEVLDRVTEAVAYCRSVTRDADPSTRWTLMFSPEAFSASDPVWCAQMCDTARAAWGPTTGPDDDPVILTLPATVEVSSPNVYADQVELFASSLSDRGEGACVSLHVHNDRGCAVAAAELGQLAGATRVEGCLFGNGERAGNVDLVTLALNLYSQGVDPRLDFSDVAGVRALVEDITAIRVHPRAPYAGELYFTAYSGAHQDAISKGLARSKQGGEPGPGGPGGRQQQHVWRVPYLPMDPEDLGSSHDSIIRLNSQSGKGGVAWTLAQELSLHQVPRGMQLEFSRAVKRASELAGGIVSPRDVADLFLERYFVSVPDPRIRSASVERVGGRENLDLLEHASNIEP